MHTKVGHHKMHAPVNMQMNAKKFVIQINPPTTLHICMCMYACVCDVYIHIKIWGGGYFGWKLENF